MVCFKKYHFFQAGLFLCSLALCLPVLAVEKDGTLPQPKRSSLFFSPNPEKSGPGPQLDYADRLLETDPEKAMKQYRALILSWPDSQEAPLAQFSYARLVEKEGKLQKAFDEYQFLVDRYAGRFRDYDDVLNSQFRIAMTLKDKKKGKFLFFPGFKSPERSLALLASILENGPQWERAAEVQYTMGTIYQEIDDYESAVVAFEVGEQRYPNSEFSHVSSFGRAYCLYLLAEESRNNELSLKEAYAALSAHISNYPDTEDTRVAIEYRKTLYRRLARIAYDKAVFYERVARRPKSALVAYEQFVREFPNSEWTGVAKIRIDALTTGMEEADEL